MAQITKYTKLFRKPGIKELEKLGLRLEQNVEWFEEETIEYLITFFQKGYFIFINNILEKAKIDIDNIPGDSLSEIIQLSYLKFLSQRVSIFKNFLMNWSRKIVINSMDNPIVFNNQIDGKILWKETFRERHFLPYPKSIKFVCTSYKNNFDSLENILIKSFLTFLKELFKDHLKYLRLSLESKKKEEDWRYHALSIYNILNKILGNYYMREITLKREACKNKYLLSRAMRSCNKNNFFLLLYANLFIDLNSPKSKDLLKRFLMDYIIKPNQDKTAELFVLFMIIKKISLIEGGREEYSIIKRATSKANPVYIKYLNNKKQIKVYYQVKPDWLSIKYPDNLFFTKTLKMFNLRNVELHPDVTIELIDGDNKKIILIEVKNSSNSSYIRQGLLQLCNYSEYLMHYENSKWVNFPKSSSNLMKEGILIVKNIPKEWKVDIDNIWSDKKFDIKLLDFNKLKSLNHNRLIEFLQF